ncbi:MAG TPA: chemotaxis response regulator protein-glutamate methylesterase [Kofleriaceae bacterium]|nr:chemotaxis response regulator protein-glutamate methylesterase [Kofleriaceae bacterium]
MAIRVLVIDDSALMRKLLVEVLRRDPAIEVVGTANDPFIARDLIKQTSPDVLTLDVEMPRMDGLTFLGNLMRLRPMPVVMISSLTERGADTTLAALELGAVDFVAKPRLDLAHGIAELADEITAKVKIAAQAHVTTPPPRARPPGKPGAPALRTTERVVAIGASTGGTEAIARILEALPPDGHGMVIAQHIAPEFTQRFAERLDGCSALVVREAGDGEPILRGHAYIAPGHRHLRVVRSGARYLCVLADEPPVNRHRPSVDVLFDSVARAAGPSAIGALLTGMGADGADGLAAMRAQGARTIAQDRETSVVWGMPGEAVKRGAAAEVLPLDQIAARLR